MKNQYFGDVNDYRKYGLLRALQWSGIGKLLVAWMLTPDDGTRDGGSRSYLRDPSTWSRHDPDLFAGLTRLLSSTPTPGVWMIEHSELLAPASYYSTEVPDAREARNVWRQGLLHAARGVDLVFIDPDNGIEICSKPIGRKASAKYVFWPEIEALWTTGCSVLVYQHFQRMPREARAQQLAQELRRRTGADLIEAFRTPHVLFLLVVQERHNPGARKGIALLRQRWAGQIEPLGLANKPLQSTAFGGG
jgi:hypothetical protein